MNEPLHPLALGEILDRTAQMYRAHFLRFLGIAVIPAAVLLAFLAAVVGVVATIKAVAGNKPLSDAQGITLGAIALVLGLVALPLCVGAMALCWAALTDATATTFLGGTFTIRGAYRSVWRRRWRLLWLLTMEALFLGVIPGSIIFATAILNAVLTALADKKGLGALGVLGAVLTVVVIAALLGGALWLLLRLCMAFAACVVEQVSAWQALKRSGELSKGTKGRLFVLFLLGYALNTGLSMLVTVLLLVVVALVPALQGQKNADKVGTVLLVALYGTYFLVKTLLTPLYGIALTLFYFDQRIRKEGFDIERMMQYAGMVSASAAVEQPAPAGGSGS
ncbi:MAG: hypothetical protein WBD67_02045 [Terracidiphilus sp.]